MRKGFRIGAAILMAAVFACPVFPQDRTAELRSRFARESNPVRKAKLMPQLGDAEFLEIQKNIAEGRTAEALAVLQQYLAESRSSKNSLDATGIDAAKHSSGFKQLQISLRESLRRLDVLIPELTADEQDPFLEIRKNISEMNVHLIRKLFPRDPNAEPAKPKDESWGQCFNHRSGNGEFRCGAAS